MARSSITIAGMGSLMNSFVEQEFTEADGTNVFQAWEVQNDINDCRMLMFSEYRGPKGTPILNEHREAVREDLAQKINSLSVNKEGLTLGEGSVNFNLH